MIEFLDGHGEADPDDAETQTGYGTIKKDLEGEGYEVRKLELAQLPKVPDDANLVVVAGPIKPLGQHEIDALNDYLKHGGRMIAMYRPQRPDNPIDEDAMVKLASEWGVKVGNDIVVDQVVRLFEGPALGLNPIVQNYGEHPITKDFKQRTVFPMSRSLTAEPNLKPGLTVTPIANTSDTSWAEVDLDTLFRQQKAELTREGHARADRGGDGGGRQPRAAGLRQRRRAHRRVRQRRVCRQSIRDARSSTATFSSTAPTG